MLILLFKKFHLENFNMCYPDTVKQGAYNSAMTNLKGWCSNVNGDKANEDYGNTSGEENENNRCSKLGYLSANATNSHEDTTKGWCKRADYGY